MPSCLPNCKSWMETTMGIRRQTLMLLVILGLPFLIATILAIRWESEPSVAELLPTDARETVEYPISVDAYRIQSFEFQDKRLDLIKPPKRISQSVTLDQDVQRRIVALLSTRRGADQEKAACIPTPGIQFVFHSDHAAIRMDVCFNCGQATFYDANNKYVSFSNITFIRSPLVKLVKAVFPSDAKVQSLSEEQSFNRDLESRP